MKNEKDFKTAFHEAAHAVIAETYAPRIRINQLLMEGASAYNPKWEGVLHIIGPKEIYWVKDDFIAFDLISMSGAIAVEFLINKTIAIKDIPLNDIDEFKKFLLGHKALGDFEIFIKNYNTQNWNNVMSLKQHLGNIIEHLIKLFNDENIFRAVLALAVELALKRRLEHSQIQEVLTRLDYYTHLNNSRSFIELKA